MPTAARVLLATTNPAKAKRLAWVFDGLGLQLTPLSGADGPGPAEEGQSFAQNARIKACYWSQCRSGLVAASDGGLVIPALGECWDALRTARAAGAAASDRDRAEHLLALAAPLVGPERRAFWREALVVAREGAPIADWTVEGADALLLDRIPDSGLLPGFWAASLCLVPSRGKTLAEMSNEELSVDDTWARLKRLVQARFGSAQADAKDVD